MPRIIDYETVLERLQSEGLRCNHFNSGAFGFPPDAGAAIRGWIGPPDSTIKPGALELARSVPAPYEKHLSDLAVRAWRDHLPGHIWVMPGSHWSFELTHGNRDWLPGLLEQTGIGPSLLSNRTNAAALQFEADEAPRAEPLLTGLLQRLTASDFFLSFPGRGTICTLHHHKQLWWVTVDSRVFSALDEMLK
jgi:hypothetical protein